MKLAKQMISSIAEDQTDNLKKYILAAKDQIKTWEEGIKDYEQKFKDADTRMKAEYKKRITKLKAQIKEKHGHIKEYESKLKDQKKDESRSKDEPADVMMSKSISEIESHLSKITAAVKKMKSNKNPSYPEAGDAGRVASDLKDIVSYL